MARVILRDKITFNMEIQNIKLLKHEFSDSFVIHGLKWSFGIKKHVACQEENLMEDTISVSLHCNIPNDLKDFMCGARARIKLVSFKDNNNSYWRYIVNVYDSEHTVWGFVPFIEWKELFSNGYVRNDGVVFEIKLEVGPLENKDCSSLIIKTIEDTYGGEEVIEKIIKIILNGIDASFVATKSVKFKFNSSMCQIAIAKYFGIEKDQFLFRLYHNHEQSSDDCVHVNYP